MRVNHREDDLENHDRGLDFDLPRLIQRRGLLKLVAGASMITLVGCAAETPADGAPGTTPSTADTGVPGTSASSSPTASAAKTVAEEIPEETAGPFPADGSNGTNILDDSGVVRSDITSSFGSSTTKAAGVPLTITMKIGDAEADGAALAGAAVYLWHCDRDGQYSLYSQGAVAENYLRGVQETDANGVVTFTSIFPACYDGRWPHIHFEVYPSLAKATSSETKIATSQIALPAEVCEAVYATEGYQQSVKNLSRVSLDRDMVFSDGYDLQLPTTTGDVKSGYALNFSCAV